MLLKCHALHFLLLPASLAPSSFALLLPLFFAIRKSSPRGWLLVPTASRPDLYRNWGRAVLQKLTPLDLAASNSTHSSMQDSKDLFFHSTSWLQIQFHHASSGCFFWGVGWVKGVQDSPGKQHWVHLWIPRYSGELGSCVLPKDQALSCSSEDKAVLEMRLVQQSTSKQKIQREKKKKETNLGFEVQI